MKPRDHEHGAPERSAGNAHLAVMSRVGAPGHHTTKLGRSGFADQVAKVLREAIIDGSLPIGAHLGEIEVAAQTGTSRGPVRTALHVLEGEGLVRTLSNGRVIVAGFD